MGLEEVLDLMEVKGEKVRAVYRKGIQRIADQEKAKALQGEMVQEP